MSHDRRWVIVAVLVLILTPVALVVVELRAYDVANRSNATLLSAGRPREYLLYVPASYNRTRPAPLVITLHGAGLWGAAMRDISRWNTVADREGVIVVYPTGVAGDGPRIWRATDEDKVGTDVTFISDLIDQIERAYNIDRARIFANGLSNGGGMSFVLSCTLADRIAAVGLVGAAHLIPFEWCPDPRPVPMVAFHGTGDRFTAYDGGKSWVAPKAFPSIPGWTASWARRNRCELQPVDIAVAADVTRREYRNCSGQADVVLYTVRGGGHTWPGGGRLPEWFVGPTSTSVDATDEMWKFFRAHPLR